MWEDIDSPYESDFRGGYFKEKRFTFKSRISHLNNSYNT